MREFLHALNNLMREMLFLPEQASTFSTRVDYLKLFPRIDRRTIGNQRRKRAAVLIGRHKKAGGRCAYPDRLAHRRGGLRAYG